MPLEVMSLMVAYSDMGETISVDWMDMLNANDDNLTYTVSYNFTALDVVLRTESNLVEAMTTSNNYTVILDCDGFCIDGVSVSVIIQPCNNFGLGTPSEMTLTFDNGQLL